MQISKERIVLVGADANDVFGEHQIVDGDVSLSALIRAIVINYGNYSISEIGEKANVLRMRVSAVSEMEYILEKSYNNIAVCIAECSKCFDEPITLPSGWQSEFELNGKAFPVNQYLSQFAKTKIVANPKQKRLVAYVERRANHIWCQALESILCRMMPWYFPSELTGEEKEFFTAISVDKKTENVEDIFAQYVNKIAEKLNFRDLKLHKYLDGIADRARQSRMSILKREVSDYRRSIDRLMADISSHYSKLDEMTLELTGLELMEPETDNAMFKFFQQHKNLTIREVDDGYLQFGVDDTLEYYDEAEFKRIAARSTTYIGRRSEELRSALNAIFVERRGIIRVNAVFNLKNYKLIEPRQNHTFIDNAMPNPHIVWYGCSGGNATYYAQYAKTGEWDLAIEQAIAATKNLNWGDSIVGSHMLDWMESTRKTPYIYVNDGNPIDKVTSDMKLVSLDEFIKLINEKGN